MVSITLAQRIEREHGLFAYSQYGQVGKPK